jgi:hypothetical protein
VKTSGKRPCAPPRRQQVRRVGKAKRAHQPEGVYGWRCVVAAWARHVPGLCPPSNFRLQPVP